MKAIDTNLIVRFLTGDHPEQAARARTLIEDERVFVATTVILEVEWVLRSVFGFGRIEIRSRLKDFAGLPNVILEDPPRIDAALAGVAGGFDFADGLHLAAAEGCEAFVTFDHALAKLAERSGGLPVKLI